MPSTRLIPFKISSVDSLGQGVCKESDRITFIPKVLPDETGLARITGEKKGVRFASLEKLETLSPSRVKPVCEHYSDCPSCHFLHTSYEQELQFKQQALEKLFRHIPHPPIVTTPAIRRTGYRNRIQLHYDKRRRLLGMLDLKNQRIAPIPKCQIGRDRLSQKLRELYQDEHWLMVVGKASERGHIELYEVGEEVKVSLNRPYAHGGFTQVFEEMNQLLKSRLTNWALQETCDRVLDLFGGNGNLSDKLNYSERLCVDYYSSSKGAGFLSVDLYADNALEKVRSSWQQSDQQTDLLIVDPPRSGVKNFSMWLKTFRPKRAIYVSCDPHTLARDLSSLKGYRLTELHLVDFFPSTFHFETMVFLEQV